MVNVQEPVAEVAKRLQEAARGGELLISFTSASFLSSVSNQVFLNPNHVTQVIEVPGAEGAR